MSTVLLSIACVALQQGATPPAPAAELERVVPVVLDAKDPVLEGRGVSEKIAYEVGFSGTLHCWTEGARDLDSILRVEDAAGQVIVESDSASGRRSPYAKLDVEPGRKLAIVVALSKPGEAAAVRVHLAASIETEATRAESKSAAEETAAIRKLRGARKLDEARRRANELAARLMQAEGGDDSESLNRAGWDLAQETKALGLLRPTGKLMGRALEHRVRTAPDDAAGLQMVRQNYAFILRDLGDLRGARDLQEKVLAVRTRILDGDDLDLQAARENLAVTIQALGDNGRARALEEQVLEIETRTLPEGHPSLQASRQNLGVTLGSLGDLTAARVLFERVLEADTAALPDDAPELQGSRGNLALMMKQLGDFAGARALEEKVLEVLSGILPDDHPQLQSARLNLATTMQMLGETEEARALLQKVLEIRTASLPDDHPELQLARQNLANTIKVEGDLEGARKLEEKVLAVYEGGLPDDHANVQKARQNLGVTRYALGDVEGARALFEKVLAIRSATMPDDHPSLQITRSTLAMLLACETGSSKDPAEAAKASERLTSMARSLSSSLTRAAELAILTASAREAEERCARIGSRLGLVIALARGLGSFPADDEVLREAFRLSETTRDASQASARLARAAHGDARYDKLRNALREASLEIAHLAQGGTNPDEFHAAVTRRDEAWRELVQAARTSASMAGGLDQIAALDVDALAARLAPREALVAYRRVAVYDCDARGSRAGALPRFCAFVMRRTSPGAGKPGAGRATFTLAVVDLGEVGSVEKAVGDWRELLGSPLERGVAAAQVEEHEGRARAAGEILRKLIVDPLLPALADAERVVFALDDVIHAVPIDALPLASGGGRATQAAARSGSDGTAPAAPEMLGERFEIEERLSLRELLVDEAPVRGPETLVALGGASFNSEPVGAAAEDVAALEAPADKEPAVASLLRGGAWERGFSPLTYTGLEAREVAALFAEVHGDRAPALVLEKRKASRESAAQLAPKARWLHLATHGWFAPESVHTWEDAPPIDELSGLAPRSAAVEQVRGSSPMVLCGLALAGANLPPSALGRYPGLVTAEEIASWDLSTCELAVLSACDTNVGVRRAGQGVASLQKALHMAGARSVITSLWKVPDEATKELMLDFYRRVWVERKPKVRALWEAKMKLRAANDENGKPKYSTRDWAAWVLTGDPN